MQKITVLLGALAVGAIAYGFSMLGMPIAGSHAATHPPTQRIETGQDFDPFTFRLIPYAPHSADSREPNFVGLFENDKLTTLHFYRAGKVAVEMNFRYYGNVPYLLDQEAPNYPHEAAYLVFTPDTLYEFYITLSVNTQLKKRHRPTLPFEYSDSLPGYCKSIDLVTIFTEGRIENAYYSEKKQCDFVPVRDIRKISNDSLWGKSTLEYSLVDSTHLQVKRWTYIERANETTLDTVCWQSPVAWMKFFPLYNNHEACE